MTATSPSDGVAAPPALAAFLRGIERRAAVLADLQSGRPERGMPALAAAMRAFRSHAAALPMADWPLRFWKLLAAVPTLRQADAADGAWSAPLAHLRSLQPADRLALLLRIVAGLDEPLAAQVLQLTTEDYQQALARACPRDAGGRPDAAGWRALADAAQQCLRDLPPARLQALAQLRDAAIAGSTASPAPAKAPAPAAAAAAARPRRRGARSALRTRLAGAVIAVVVLALVGTVFWDRLPWHRSRAATRPRPVAATRAWRWAIPARCRWKCCRRNRTPPARRRCRPTRRRRCRSRRSTTWISMRGTRPARRRRGSSAAPPAPPTWPRPPKPRRRPPLPRPSRPRRPRHRR
ncbi:hypothetical protein NG831_03330 [Xanthomonas sacchari]|nr:hypothetical protein [Xanthomonas sacchari]UYK67246.1 hypothetical protein NG831_03330 [Xanthomonas sacchari]